MTEFTDYTKIRRAKRRQAVIELKGGRCRACGTGPQDESTLVLFYLGRRISWSKVCDTKIDVRSRFYLLICANCAARAEAGALDLQHKASEIIFALDNKMRIAEWAGVGVTEAQSTTEESNAIRNAAADLDFSGLEVALGLLKNAVSLETAVYPRKLGHYMTNALIALKDFSKENQGLIDFLLRRNCLAASSAEPQST